MSDKGAEILKTFGRVLPKLTERDKERLLWFGEGLAFKVEKEKAKGPPKPIQSTERPA